MSSIVTGERGHILLHEQYSGAGERGQILLQE